MIALWRQYDILLLMTSNPAAPRYASPALAAELARWPEPPAHLDGAAGLTPTPGRAYSPAQLLLVAHAPARLAPRRSAT